MQNHFPKTQFMLALLFVAVSSLLFFFLYHEINVNDQKAQNSMITWETENSRREQIMSLNDSIAAIQTEKTQLETHFISSADVVPFLNTIEGLGPEVGVKANVVSVNVVSDNSGLLVSMSASGSFENIYKFLTLLENAPYEIVFESADINTISAQGAAATDTAKNVKEVAPVWQANFSMKLVSFTP